VGIGFNKRASKLELGREIMACSMMTSPFVWRKELAEQFPGNFQATLVVILQNVIIMAGYMQ